MASFLVLMLGGFCFTLYLGAMQWVEPWRREVLLENNMHLVLQRLSNDLAGAEQYIIDETPRTWVLTYPSGRVITYQWREGVLTRDGQRMLDAEMRVVGLTFLPSRQNTLWARRRAVAFGEDERNPIKIDLQLVVQSPDRMLSMTTTVALRRHRPWSPLD